MPAISNLGYFVIGVSDLDTWQRFAVDVIGMQVVQRSSQHLALRIDDMRQRILLERGGDDDLQVAGWEFSTEKELDSFVLQLQSRGIAVQEPGSEAAAARRVRKLFRCIDPNGLAHELYFGAEQAHMTDPFRSQVLRSRFVAGDLGVGHFVALAKDAQETLDFYLHTLGLSVSDHVRSEVRPGLTMHTTFLHAKTGRHHSVAALKHPLPFPKRIHHIMVEVADLNDVGLAYDRCLHAGLPIEMTLGHHPNDGMTSFYVRTPSGFALEFGWGGRVVDDADWTVKSYVGNSDWGHMKRAAGEGARHES